MAEYKGRKISDTYQSVIKTEPNTEIPEADKVQLTDGNGNETGVYMGRKQGVSFSPGNITSQNFQDYEEGTFTPTFPNAPPGVTAFTRYIRIGNIVHIIIALNIPNNNNPNNIIIQGLPFDNETTNPANNNRYGTIGYLFLINPITIDPGFTVRARFYLPALSNIWSLEFWRSQGFIATWNNPGLINRGWNLSSFYLIY